MERDEIKSGMLLRNTIDGKIGVPFIGIDYGCLDRSREVGIIYQAEDGNQKATSPPFIGTMFEHLEPHELQLEETLTDEHVNDVCKPGQENDTCRYLTMGRDGYSCAKVAASHSIAFAIDDRVRQETIRARGNNCGGRYNPKELAM